MAAFLRSWSKIQRRGAAPEFKRRGAEGQRIRDFELVLRSTALTKLYSGYNFSVWFCLSSEDHKMTGDKTMQENRVSKEILDSAIVVHRTLGGPGLLESVYEEALILELQHRSLCVERQLEVPITYKGHCLSTPLRLDLLVAECVVVEVKATTQYNSIYEAQALTYLRLMNLRLALVINFGEQYVKNGYHRVINSKVLPTA